MRKPRKFNRHTARKIMAWNLRGRIKTRDGRPVRIVAWDARGAWPIVGLICFDDLDTELSWQWTRKGVPYGHSDYSSNDFTLVIELKKNVLSSTARYQRVTKKKKNTSTKPNDHRPR